MSATISILPVGNLSGLDPESLLSSVESIGVGAHVAIATGVGIGSYFLFKKHHPVWGTLLALSAVGHLGMAAASALFGKANSLANNAAGAVWSSSHNYVGLPPGPGGIINAQGAVPAKTTGPVAWEA